MTRGISQATDERGVTHYVRGLVRFIGRTDAELWDVDRDPPALLRPGMWVQFREVSS